MRFLRVISILCACAAATTSVSAQGKPPGIKAVHLGKLWDGKGKVWSNAIVIVQGERIRAVTTDAGTIPPGAEVIDLAKFTGLPGLIDAHTHMTIYTEEALGVPMLKQVNNVNAGFVVFMARKGAMRTLEAGVTTVRDLGADQYMDIAMRDLINRGEMAGPRMFVCGYGLYTTFTPFKPGAAPPVGGVADGVPEVLRAVRQQLAAGADVIKMYASTGTDDDVTGFQTYSYEEIKAAVDMAHQFQKKIAVHSYGPDGARDAVRAGADSVEHATDMDDSRDGEARDVLRSDGGSQPVLHRERRQNRLCAGIQRAASCVHSPEFGDGAASVQGRRENRDGVRRDLYHVRPEHAGAELVCEGRNDAGAGARGGNSQRSGAVGERERAWRGGARIFCGFSRRGGRSARGYQHRLEQRAVGDEGWRRGG